MALLFMEEYPFFVRDFSFVVISFDGLTADSFGGVAKSQSSNKMRSG